MNRQSLEITTSIGCVAAFIIMILAAGILMPSHNGFGYSAALLVFMLMMGFTGKFLAERGG